jgi:hypothetical protein
MSRAKEIRDKVRQWLVGEISYHQFEDWFVPVAGTIATESDLEAESLVHDIDMSMSEYSDGVLSAQELRAEVESAIRPFALPVVRYRVISPPQAVTISLRAGTLPRKARFEADSEFGSADLVFGKVARAS